MIPCWILRHIKPRSFSSAFDAATDIEKIVRCKSVKELAELLDDANVKNDFVKRTVIEHALSVRIAHIQTHSAMIGVVWTLIGAALGAYLQAYYGVENKYPAACNSDIQRPVSEPEEPMTHRIEPINVINNCYQGNDKQQNGIKNP